MMRGILGLALGWVSVIHGFDDFLETPQVPEGVSKISLSELQENELSSRRRKNYPQLLQHIRAVLDRLISGLFSGAQYAPPPPPRR